MLTEEGKRNNHDSWAQSAFGVEHTPDKGSWLLYKPFVRRIFQLGDREGLYSYFRAGQSMEHIIFSTCERHRLESYEPAPPCVTLVWQQEQAFVAASYTNLHFHEPIRKTIVTSENVWPVLKSYLIELWRETRPEEPLPKPISQKD